MERDAFQIEAEKRYAIREAREEALAEGEAKGRAEGEAKGRAEGEAKGKAENQREIAKNLLKLGADTIMVSKATGLSEEEIKAL